MGGVDAGRRQRGDRPFDAVRIHHLNGFFRGPVWQRRTRDSVQPSGIHRIDECGWNDVMVDIDTALLD